MILLSPSIYFGAGSRVRCVAQAFTVDGTPGIESYSEPVVVDPSNGLCMPKKVSDLGAETFSAQVSSSLNYVFGLTLSLRICCEQNKHRLDNYVKLVNYVKV